MKLLDGFPGSPAVSLWIRLAAGLGWEPELESRVPQEGLSGSIPHRNSMVQGVMDQAVCNEMSRPCMVCLGYLLGTQGCC